MGNDYTNTSLGYPIFDVVSTVKCGSTLPKVLKETDKSKIEGKNTAEDFEPLPSNAFIVVGGGGSSRSGIKNCISILKLEMNKQGLVLAVPLLNFDTGSSCCTSVDIATSGRLLSASVGASTVVYSLGYDTDSQLLKQKAQEDGTSRTPEFSKKYKLSKITEFVTDKPIDNSVIPCQNVVKFSSSADNLLATGGDDCCVYIWQLSIKNEHNVKLKCKSELLHKLRGHTKEIKDIDFDLDDRFLASASVDQSCRIWDIQTGELVQLLPADVTAHLSYRRCKFLSNSELMTLQTTIGGRGSSFLVLWKKKKIWEVAKATMVSKGMATSFCFTSKRKYLGVSEANGSVLLLDGTKLTLLKRFKDIHNLPITGVSLSLLNSTEYNSKQKEFLITSSMDRIVSMIEVKYSPFQNFLRRLLYFLFLFLAVFIVVYFYFMNAEDKTPSQKDEL